MKGYGTLRTKAWEARINSELSAERARHSSGMNARIGADPDLMRQRRRAAEHPFGTIKRMTADGRFLNRGITKVKAEAALSILAYNILRAINLIGSFDLRARLA